MPFDPTPGEYELDIYDRSEQIQAARRDPNAFIEYVFRGEGGQRLKQEKAHREWQEIWSRYDRSVILGPIGCGKALPVETPIAVPGGWKPIGELEVGDMVIGGDGLPTRVTYVSPVMHDRVVYELAFGDDSTIACDADHLWTVSAKHGPTREREWCTRTTQQILESLDMVWRIPCVGLYGPERRIVAWRRLPSCPVRCIAVEANHHTFVATAAEIVTHNTTQIRGRLIHEIGSDPEDTRIAWVSATQAHPKKQLGSIKEEIARNPRIWHVFPWLRRGEGEREEWSSTKILVQRDSSHPDVTLECYGAYGSILGSRKTIIVFDDLCNFANTLTQASREKMIDWLAEVLSRAKGRIRMRGIGHIWHADDALQALRKKPGWFYARYEATVTQPDPTPEDPARTKEVPTFPSVLSMLKIASLCVDLGPVYSEMMLWNRLPPATMSRFADSWFERCLENGRGLAEQWRPEDIDSRGRVRADAGTFGEDSAGTIDKWKSKGYRSQWTGAGKVFTAADLGHTKKVGSDLTVFITCVVFADGQRLIIDVRAGRWKGDEIATQIQDLRTRFDPKFFVESNGGQGLFIDLVQDTFAIPINKSHTGMDKYSYQNGIESIGTELRNGWWTLPCTRDLEPPPEVAEMIKGAKGYSPEKHPSDYLMAWWILRKGIVQFGGEPAPDVDPQANM